MGELNFGISGFDPSAGLNKGYDYAQKIQNLATNRAAGAQYASGDYSGASQTLAKSGNIAEADTLRQTGQQTNTAGIAYIGKALPVFQAVLKQHANDPDGGRQALAAVVDHITPEAIAATGTNPQTMAAVKQSFMADPQGTILRMQSQLPVQYQNLEGTLYGVQGMQATQIAQQPKFLQQPIGSSTVPVNQAAADAMNAQSSGSEQHAAPAAAPQGPLPGGQLIASADPNAMHTVESNNNPNAVNPQSGAMGISQTMPSTLAAPGFGVAPAANGSPQEQQRVGDQYLQAMAQKYNGNAVFAHIAYDMGPGATDRWIASGAKFSTLPKETQDYLGKIAIAQATQGGQPQPPAQAGGQSPAAPTGQPQARVGVPMGGGAPPIDKDAINNDVRIWLASKGTINPQYGMGTAGFMMRQAFDTAKNQLMKNLNVTPEDVASGQAIRKADTASLTQMSKLQSTIGSFEQTARKNADLALSLAPKGGAQGQVPLFNRWVQAGRKSLAGNPDVAAFDAALGTFADEYAKVVSGSTNGTGTTDAAKATAESRINSAMTQQQLVSVVNTMKQEMANRTSSLSDSVNEIKSRLGNSGGAPQATPSSVLRIDINGKQIK